MKKRCCQMTFVSEVFSSRCKKIRICLSKDCIMRMNFLYIDDQLSR